MCIPLTHKWVTFKEGKIEDGRGNIVGQVFLLRCDKCGDIKTKRITIDPWWLYWLKA